MEQSLFVIIYITILYQLYLGITNNFTNSIFGVCSSEITKNIIDINKSIFSNYIKSIGIKKIGHILQGIILGMLLLIKYDVSRLFTKIFNNQDIVCKKNNYKSISILILSFISIILWQLNIIPIIIPLLCCLMLFPIIYKSCTTNQTNLFMLIVSCGYLLYNLGKRGYHKSIFIESSYFSNLFDFFVGLTISIPLFLILNTKNKIKLELHNSIVYIIMFIFVINTLSVVQLVKYSKVNFDGINTLQQLQAICKKNK